MSVTTEDKGTGVTGGAFIDNRAFEVSQIKIIGGEPGGYSLKTPRKIIFITSDGGDMTTEAQITDQTESEGGRRGGCGSNSEGRGRPAFVKTSARHGGSGVLTKKKGA